MLLKYHNNKCNFIFEEVKNKLVNLLTNPVSYSFVNKILLYLNKSDKNNLKLFIWDIYKKEYLIKSLYETPNGQEFISRTFNYSNDDQKKFLKSQLDINKK